MNFWGFSIWSSLRRHLCRKCRWEGSELYVRTHTHITEPPCYLTKQNKSLLLRYILYGGGSSLLLSCRWFYYITSVLFVIIGLTFDIHVVNEECEIGQLAHEYQIARTAHVRVQAKGLHLITHNISNSNIFIPIFNYALIKQQNL